MATETISLPSWYEPRSAVDTSETKYDHDEISFRPSIADEATHILNRCLLQNRDLNIPYSVSAYASAVIFHPRAEPFMLTPMKMSESVSALWACIGLFASSICQERYHTAKPQKIEVDVHSATLMLMSLALFEIEGLEAGELKTRVDHLDKGRISETYRAMATNMYGSSNLCKFGALSIC
jgi:hypothetical protein